MNNYYKEKMLKRFEIKEIEYTDKKELCIYILDDNYNFIKKIIYDEKLAKNILEQLEKAIYE